MHIGFTFIQHFTNLKLQNYLIYDKYTVINFTGVYIIMYRNISAIFHKTSNNQYFNKIFLVAKFDLYTSFVSRFLQ